MPFRHLSDALTSFLKLESAGGLLLIAWAALALILSNTGLKDFYESVVFMPVEVRVGPLLLAKPLLLWINDGLMSIFFLLVGLEVKREILDGELSTPSQIVLPAAAALGGMLLPAAIFYFLNRGDDFVLRGWAIPTATDIAFALGVLSLLGSRVPGSLKLFLTTVAIADDLGAIVIIAVFYTSELTLPMLVAAGVAMLVLVLLNLFRVRIISIYMVVGVVLWFFMLKSGVHATLAGVVLAFTIPLKVQDANGQSLLRSLEHRLHHWVAFAILPIFAFANAGVSFEGVDVNALLQPLPAGIMLGLVVGKFLGVFGVSWLLIRTGRAKLPVGAEPIHLLGVAVLCGIGFTMSLFIGSLAFETADYLNAVRLGVVLGSSVAAVGGFALLRLASKANSANAPSTATGMTSQPDSGSPRDG
ncbi:MAG TPA: Na+/H+ antiporter NhaA [Burkholderiaceae bacterium]|nr:Na+/H+ antiporter NhaA [Burkholderiaceae bacterium]